MLQNSFFFTVFVFEFLFNQEEIFLTVTKTDGILFFSVWCTKVVVGGIAYTFDISENYSLILLTEFIGHYLGENVF